MRLIGIVSDNYPSEFDTVMTLILRHRQCSFDIIKSAIQKCMSHDIRVPVDGSELSLPCYLARTNQLELLLRLLDKSVLTFSSCGVVPKDMWEQITIADEQVPLLISVMEHFGKALNKSSRGSLREWLMSNSTMSRELTDELSKTSNETFYVARAVMEATPINTHALTIAVKKNCVYWVKREAERLSLESPEGYKTWKSFFVDLKKKVFIQKPMFEVLAPLAPEYLSAPADESSKKLKAEVAQLKEYMASVVCSLQSV